MRHRVCAIVLLLPSLATAQPSQPESSPPPSDEVLDLSGDPHAQYQSPESLPQQEQPQEPVSTPASAASSPVAETTAPATTTPPAEPIPTTAETPTHTGAAASPTTESSGADSTCARKWVRDGFYLRSISGVAHLSVWGEGPRGDAALSGMGSSSTVAIGGTPVRGLVLAGTLETLTLTAEFEGGPFGDVTIPLGEDEVDASSNATVAHLQLGALVDWYPDPDAGWHVGLGGGLGLLSLVNHADNGVMVGVGAAGAVVGGHDWLIGRKWSIGLGLRVSASTPMKLRDDEGEETGYELALWSVGLGGSILYY